MNKIIFLILIYFLFINANAQQLPTFSKALKIEHVHGDEYHAVEGMSFENRNGKVYGKISIPNTDSLLPSETLLDNSEIKTLNAFLKLVEQYKDSCTEKHFSSSVRYYTIQKDNQEIKIFRFCDWKKLTYFDIRNKIFGGYLKRLEKEKEKLNASYSVLLKGKWKSDILLPQLKADSSIYTAEKTNDLSPEKNKYIEFTNEKKAKFYRGDKTVNYNYYIEVLNGNKYLWLLGDNSRDDDEFIYSHKFLIISLSQNKMSLTRSYQY
ncbi:hypothetical protein NAT51_15990 [Flavobacterium amniphilum]|uniref:hypothetical protein n=1 Tax=Flavobacterium amniphilum TaxID=1834035 RepID=UPI002029E96A|nr:hypothetical protein [Flavobacterium amniphilum]MCL9807036.1 hypothetical protein [Flavobacterium amniphilum]